MPESGCTRANCNERGLPMNSTERVRNTILGKEFDRQPIYGWLYADLKKQITEAYGSIENFEDKYEFDVAHLFGGPGSIKKAVTDKVAEVADELEPEDMAEIAAADIFNDPDDAAAYEGLKKSLEHHKARERFCYVQTPGFFEHFNGLFGIENQLMYLGLCPEELGRLYARQADWTIKFADNCIDMGIDMIHISDDWGSQKSLMFSPKLWWKYIYPNLKKVVDHVHSRGALASLHSDGCVMEVADGLADVGLDVVHPWQENAGMSLDVYLDKYQDKFGILGGVCVQSVIGLLPTDEMLADIRRVFGKLRGKRWICCTSHFVTDACSMEDLGAAYDLIYELARK